MPVRVDVPIRIRVDPGALARRSCCIKSALSAAVGRALRKSADTVLAARGGYVGVQIHPPEFRWYGDGLGHVPQGLRLKTQQLVASVLGEGAIGLGKSERSDGSDVPESASVQEALDPARVDEGLGIYFVPSYDGRRRTAIQVKKKGRPKPVRYGWRSFSGLEQVLGRADFDELIDQAVSRWGVVAGPEDRGFIWREGRSLGFVLFRVAGGQLEIAHQGAIGATPEYKLDAKSGDWIKAPSSWPPAPGRTTIRYLSAVPPGLSERERLVAKLFKDSIRDYVRSVLEKSKKLDTSDPLFEKRVEEESLEEVTRQAKAIPADTIGLWEYEIGSYVSHVYIPLLGDARDKWRGTATLLPFTFKKKPPKPRTQGEGGEAGAAEARAAKGQGTGPTGPEGVEGKPSPPVGDPNAIFRDCKDNYSDHSALYPEQYLDDTNFGKCRSLLGEPSLNQLGGDGQPLLIKMNWLAGELGISPCEYAGNFCLGAGQAIARQARQLGEYAVTNEAGRAGVITPSTQGNLGFIQFDPQSTPAIAELQRLARLLDQVIDLGDDTQRVYEAWWENLCGRWYQYPSGWALAFDVLFHPIKVDAVGNLFKSTCRVLLLQLLEASRSQIDARKKNLPTYAPVFEVVLRAYFTNKGELLKLKARLEQATALFGMMPGVLNPQSSQSWLELRTGLIAAVNKGNQAPTDSLVIRDGLVFNGDELVGIQDEHANLWTKQSLEQALSQREYLVESIDPLVKQFSDREASFTLAALNQKDKAPDLVGYFMKAGDLEGAVLRRVYRDKKVTTEAVVGSILDEMLRQNGDRTSETKSDYGYAFDAAPLHKDAPKSAIPYCSFVLQGIHKLAHDQIGPAFRSNPNQYGWALDHVIGARYGFEQLTWFAETVGIAILSVLCPPLGAVAGLAVSVLDYNKALEKKALFRSLIDPDVVISRAEVEAALFAAELGLVLSFLPNGKMILSGATRGIEVVSQQGVRGSARAVVTRARRGLTRQGAATAAAAIRERFGRGVAEALKDDFAVALSIELVTDQAMDLFMSKLLIDPIVDSIFREYQDYAPGARGPGRIVSSLAGPGSTGSTALPGGVQ